MLLLNGSEQSIFMLTAWEDGNGNC